MVKIEKVTAEDIETVRSLFLEYASSLNFDLCFQNFSEELKNLPGDYSPPSGSLLLANYEGEPAGCIALRRIDDRTCEMKRLYVKDIFRGKNIGKLLVDKIILEAKIIGYDKMRLDTTSTMRSAQKLYRSAGFYEIDPYYPNPLEGVLYMELKLAV